MCATSVKKKTKYDYQSLHPHSTLPQIPCSIFRVDFKNVIKVNFDSGFPEPKNHFEVV